MLAGLLVLALGEWVDRADLGAAPLQALEPPLDLAALGIAQGPLRRPDLLPQPLADLGQLLGCLRAPVAEVGGIDLGPGQLVGEPLQLRLKLGLAL